MVGGFCLSTSSRCRGRKKSMNSNFNNSLDPHEVSKCDLCGRHKESVRQRRVATVGLQSRNKMLSSIFDRVRRFLSRKASRDSDTTNSRQRSSESRSNQRVYLRQGILESNQDFADRMLRAMREKGIIP